MPHKPAYIPGPVMSGVTYADIGIIRDDKSETILYEDDYI